MTHYNFLLKFDRHFQLLILLLKGIISTNGFQITHKERGKLVRRTYLELDFNEQKLRRYSLLSSSLLYGPLFGYSLNKDLFYLWLAIVLCGGISLLFTSKWIRTEMRRKVMSSVILITLLLDIWIFSDSIAVPMFIKQVVFLLVFFVFGYKFFKLLYNGQLAIKDEAAHHIH
ncbi:hypothetical protein D3C78_1112150 [compost metagenome]